MKTGTAQSPLFELGHVVATASVNEQLAQPHRSVVIQWLQRHARGDWGDIHPDDNGLNEAAITSGARILSVYTVPDELAAHCDDPTVWIITDAADDRGNRTTTTVLYPTEY